MKKRLITLFIALITSVSMYAGQAQDNCGCGLGTVLWEGKSDDSLIFQLLQVTTNATSGNQTFGITSGTLGCQQPNGVVDMDQISYFIDQNMDNLARDIAVGQGETLETVAEMMAIPAEKRDEFASVLQSNFSQIFKTGNESASTVLESIYKIAG